MPTPKATRDRNDRLMPAGIPRWIRCYDNGGRSIDRYFVVYTGHYPKNGHFASISMSAAPFHPQGVGQHGEDPCPPDTYKEGRPGGWPPAVGRKHWNPAIGRRIAFADLPPDCQRAVLQDYRALWSIPTET